MVFSARTYVIQLMLISIDLSPLLPYISPNVTLTILVLLDQSLDILLQTPTRRVLRSDDVPSYEIVVPHIDNLDLRCVGLFDLGGELGGGYVFVWWVEGHVGSVSGKGGKGATERQDG